MFFTELCFLQKYGIFITEVWYVITELYYDNETLIFQYHNQYHNQNHNQNHKQNHKKNQTLTSFATLDIIFL